jgi:hypothetical protein
MLSESCRYMALVRSAENNVSTPIKTTSFNDYVTSLLLLNHGVSVDITGNDGRIPLKAAACNGHLEGN